MLSSEESRVRGSSWIFWISMIIIFGSLLLVCQASNSVPDCIIYTFNGDTGRLECSDVTEVEFGGSTSSSNGDLKPIRNVVLFCFFLVVVIIFFYCVRNCGPSFGRGFSRNENENNWHGSRFGVRRLSSTTTSPPSAPFPQTHSHIIVVSPSIPSNNNNGRQAAASIVDADLPEYQPPPGYHECVLNLSDEVPKKHGIPQS